ncbi:MAG: 23S rRNA (guanosine(2251)-2'-O)-methyltransferase RlmB [Sulfuriflexus sp.]|nr:23S rRNA (guanosine(2251)-2'-O)-methyltransferase RlmB [Sulfuriflexus sp.]
MAEQRVYGFHSIEAILQNEPERILEVWLLEGRQDKRLESVLSLLSTHGIRHQKVKREKLDELAGSSRHQGIVAHCREAPNRNENFLDQLLDSLDVPPFLLILDGVQDPHNLGACLRTADAVGVHAVIVPKDNAATLNGTVRKVACGAAETTPFVTVTNLARCLRNLKERGIWLVGAAGEVDTNIYQQDMTGPLALIMGAEGKGLRRLTRETCDHLVTIPMPGGMESLNVSVATGVCLYEALRQRGNTV